MSNRLKTVLVGAAVLAATPALALDLQSGSSTTSTTGFGSVLNTLGISTTVTGNGVNYSGGVSTTVGGGSAPGTTSSSATSSGGGSGTGSLSISNTNLAETVGKGPAAVSAGVSTVVATGQNGTPVAVDVSVGVSKTSPFGSSASTFVIGGGLGSNSKTTITH